MSVNCMAKIQVSGIPSDKFGNVGGNIFITAEGYVTPCCWMGTFIRLDELWEQSNIDKKMHNLNHFSIDDIIKGPIFKWIDNNMETFDVCQFKCNKKKYDKVISVVNISV